MSEKDASKIELDNFWPYHAVVLADQISRYTHSVVKSEAGLNISQWRVLAAVADKPGRTAVDVTNITPMDKTIVSRAVSSLIEAGLIRKTPTATDKRRQALQMTPEGLSIYERISRKLNKALIGSLLNENEGQAFIKTLKDFSQKMRLI